VDGSATLRADDDLAGVPIHLQLKCFKDQEKADALMTEAIQAISAAMAPYKGDEKTDRVLKPTVALVRKTPYHIEKKQNNKGEWKDFPTITAGCENSWCGDAYVTLITHKIKDVGKAVDAISHEIKEAKLRRPGDGKKIQETLSVTIDPVQFWLTPEGRKPMEAKALALAWADHWKKWYATNADCHFQEAYVKSISEVLTPLPQPRPKLAMINKSAPAEPVPVVEAVEITSAGKDVTAKLSVVWNVQSPNRCLKQKNAQ
jgi:hypothetical protein